VDLGNEITERNNINGYDIMREEEEDEVREKRLWENNKILSSVTVV